jgi:hypothetical protein
MRKESGQSLSIKDTAKIVAPYAVILFGPFEAGYYYTQSQPGYAILNGAISLLSAAFVVRDIENGLNKKDQLSHDIEQVRYNVNLPEDLLAPKRSLNRLLSYGLGSLWLGSAMFSSFMSGMTRNDTDLTPQNPQGFLISAALLGVPTAISASLAIINRSKQSYLNSLLQTRG